MTNRTLTFARSVASALVLASMLLACAAADSDGDAMPMLVNDETVRVTSREHVDVDVRPYGPVRVGKNTIFVSFPAQKAELASASALMAAHGHGSRNPAIERDGDRFVIRDLVFFMSGRWELRLALQIDAHEDEAVVLVDVP